MGTENIAKEMDDLFNENRSTEMVAAGEAIGLLGMVIRKCATCEMSNEEMRAMMQRGYLVAEQVEKWASQDGDGEVDDSIAVPVDLLEAVRKDADGRDAEVIPISKAMEIIKSRLVETEPAANATEDDGEDNTTVDWSIDVSKSDEEEEEHRLDEDDEWGSDPAGVRG